MLLVNFMTSLFSYNYILYWLFGYIKLLCSAKFVAPSFVLITAD